MILFYTGTGNSEFVARRIGATIGDEVVNLFSKLRNHDYTALSSDKPWVICAPTYAWQLPHIVRDWIKKTTLMGSRDIYFVLTCGGDVGGAGKFAQKLAEGKNMNYMGLAKVVMPENYIAMFAAPEEAEARKIVNTALPTIDSIAEVIKNGKKIEVKASALGGFLSSVINAGFGKTAMRDGKFNVSVDKCIGCGQCERDCPTGNIVMKDGKPTWNGKCTQCMACICKCPQAAIEYGKTSVGKPRYKCPDM